MFGNLKPRRGTVHIKNDWCKGCGFCVQYCPVDVLALSKEFNKKGYHPPFAKNQEDCTDCRFCELICREFAIYVTTKEDEEQHAS